MEAVKLQEKRKEKKKRIKDLTQLRKTRESNIGNNNVDDDGEFDWDRAIEEIHKPRQNTKKKYQLEKISIKFK